MSDYTTIGVSCQGGFKFLLVHKIHETGSQGENRKPPVSFLLRDTVQGSGVPPCRQVDSLPLCSPSSPLRSGRGSGMQGLGKALPFKIPWDCGGLLKFGPTVESCSPVMSQKAAHEGRPGLPRSSRILDYTIRTECVSPFVTGNEFPPTGAGILAPLSSPVMPEKPSFATARNSTAASMSFSAISFCSLASI